MAETHTVHGQMAALQIDNLDTDQIMPKQFLHGVDKSGLAQGLLHDLRFDAQGQPKPECVLNRAGPAGVQVLLAGANFGCGSSREHAVWGLQQYGIQAIVAPSFGEIFYANAMNNRLLLVVLPAEQVAHLMALADSAAAPALHIDVQALTLSCAGRTWAFSLSQRHHRMFLQGLDMIGLSLAQQAQISAFAQAHWAAQPWLRDLAPRLLAGQPAAG